jgi:hypothetical protein
LNTNTHSLRWFTIVIGLLAVLCSISNTAKAQTVTITSPSTITYGSNLTATATTSIVLLGVNYVSFSFNGVPFVQDPTSPYEVTFTTNTLVPGTYTLSTFMNYNSLVGAVNSATFTQTVTIIPSTPIAPATSACLGSTANIAVSGSAPTGGAYNLYTASTGGTAIASTTGTTLVTPVITATTTYYVGYTSNGIESIRRAVTVTANPLPAVPTFTVSPATIAVGAAATVSITPVAGITYSLDYDGGTGTGSGTGPFSVTWATAGRKRITVTATNANGCTNTSYQSILVTKPFAGNYAFSQGITLNTNLIGITTTLTNFPVLVYIQEDALKSGVNCANNIQFPNAGATGYDFAFTTSTGTDELFYQVESFNATTGTLLAWVQVPTVTSAATSLKFHFGSLTPAHDATFARGTWATDYQLVYHFNEASSIVLDATVNQRWGTATNAVTTTSGKITSAYTFNGTSTKMITAVPADITGSFTLSGWAYVTDFNTSTDQKILTNETSYTSGGYKLGYYGATAAAVKTEVETRTNAGAATLNRGETGGTVITTGSWHYVQGIYNGSNFLTFQNGAADRSTTAGVAAGVGGPVYIGSDFAAANFFKGMMDEIRISNVAKSADWIKAEYYNQNNPTTFTTTDANFTTNAANAKAIGASLVYTWTGASSSVFTTAGNWRTPASGNPVATAAMPIDGSASIMIPSGLANYPALNTDAALFGVTIASNANINLGSNVLTVGCNVYNSGRINTAGTTSASSIIFNGSFTPQLYTGNTTTANTAQFGNFTVNNTAAGGQVRLSGGPVDVYNTLTLTNGSLFVDNTNSGALTLKSSGTATARVAELTSTARTITGNVTVERWFTGGTIANRGWRLMSSPVNNTSTIPASASAMYNFTSLKTNLNITGSGTNFDASASNGATILFYNTATKLFTWPSDPTTTNRNIGSGFYFYFRGSRTGADKLTRVGGVYATPEPNVVGLQTGVLNQHSFTYTLSNANTGFNQVGNPYPSSISMPSGSANATLVGTTNFVYTYISNANSISPQPVAVTIASGQGFFVKSNSATSFINFTEALKTANQPTAPNLLLGAPMGTEIPAISFKMAQDSVNYDITHLRYLDTYKNEYDEMEDADDLNGPSQNVFFGAITSDNRQVAIASQPLGQQKSSVFLSVNDNYSGTYSIEKINLAGIPDVYDIWLMDHFKNDSLDLRANSVYNFNLDKANPQTFGSSRFEVVIRKKSLPPYQLLSFKGTRVANDVMLKWNTANEYDHTSFELQKSTDGTTFEAVKNMGSSSQGSYSFKDIYNTGSTANVYYRLKQTDINDAVTYSDIIIVSTQGEGTFNIFPNPATNVIQYRLKEDTKGTINLKIYNSMGILIKNSTFTTPTGQQDISSLMPGSYTIEVTDKNNKKTLLAGKFIKL